MHKARNTWRSQTDDGLTGACDSEVTAGWSRGGVQQAEDIKSLKQGSSGNTKWGVISILMVGENNYSYEKASEKRDETKVLGEYRGKNYYYYYLNILFIFREGKGGRKRGRETSMCGCLSSVTLLGTWPANPGMCPDWVSNQRHFGLQASPQSTEPHQTERGENGCQTV